ncbi:TrbC/VirB2 family protein [Bacteroides fragilis]|uniref:TrbC/VirB2 family protein n=1 Tax=Bacteroides fragilis TaxID=817 RepID=UPI00321BFE72
MNKVKQLLSNSKLKVAAAVSTAAVLIPQYAFAAGESEAIGTALTSIQTDLLASIKTVAPIAIGIFGATFVWKKGIRFFSTIANK